MFNWYDPPTQELKGRCPVCDKRQDHNDYCNTNCFQADNPYDI
jgi:hypothetical protein